ncbi:MAG: acyl-ACP--UDP-N-acetylglucosamine O-acyltransferase [Paludibacteraceae bacterium]|nr:acyl-ACP--UDP-N-acetylglucosamine O-acyltransferase [Paludibacteraceae bacterium]MBN2787708.1 acyl-ACP--UDP-N-acetylglucosamine O-acyltransferase [Paludibacteraceae bacterium]
MQNLNSSIHPEAKIGANVTIGPFVTIDKNVVIGDGTMIMPHATILDGARIGKNCRIFPCAVISGIPQDLKFQGEETTAEIGDNTTIREGATVNRGTASKGKTVVGKNCLIMAYCHIGHDCFLGDNIIISNSTQLAGEVIVDDNAVISGGVLIHQFSHIGAHVMIQGGARVMKDVPPYITAGRDPLCFVGLNSIGLRRRGYTIEQIDRIQHIYRLIYQSALNTSQALEQMEKELPESEERTYIENFIKNSSRGIIRGTLE